MQNAVNFLSSYLPHDRRKALAQGESLPDRVQGAALFADISGFTPLTERLTEMLGPRRGVEELSRHLNTVYDALISEVETWGGSVVSFAGDAITCWFSGEAATKNAVACAFRMHQGMKAFFSLPLPDGTATTIAVKTSIAYGPVRRFVVGDPLIQLHDVLAGETIDRMAAGEKLSRKGETLVDEATAARLGDVIRLVEWRDDPETHHRFAVVMPTQAFRSFQPPNETSEDTAIEIQLDQLTPWLIPAISVRLQSGQGEFLTELRPGVPVFVKFLGIDFESEEACPQLDRFVRRLQQILARHEGTLIDLTVGDKGSYLHASFGAITIHEDDTRRAVQAALEFQHIAGELPFLQHMQIGISRGTLRTGAYGGRSRRVYGALGDDVNLAARLMEAAHPGEIVISGWVQKTLGERFETAPRAPLHVKGKVEPVSVFVVQRQRRESAIRLQEPHFDLPMVGRRAETQILVEKMEQALIGKGQIVGIVAEAGMGKSRLVAEAIRIARAKGFTGYGGACQSGGISTPYLVWRSIWQAFFEVDADLPAEVQNAHLEQALKTYAPHRVEALPLLGTLLGLPLPDNPFTQTLDPEFRKSALEALLVDCLKGVFQPSHEIGTGLLLVLEDLHWIDPLSRDLLEEIVRACAGLPVMIILAYRPWEAHYQTPLDLESYPNFTLLPLTELSDEELETLVCARLSFLFPTENTPHGPVLDRLVAQISERAQGNPFYAEELLNYLHDQGLNPYDPTVVESIELPNSLHQLILSRIDQLTEREKTTLKVASVIGRLFPVTWVHGYYPSLGTLEQIKSDLEELRHLDLTPLDTPEPELAYLFKHIVTQEVTYESLSYEMRARLHEQLAQYLEKARLATRLPLLDLLAFHYGRSENQAKQREYFLKAGEAAQAAYANSAALDYYERLLSLSTTEEQIQILLKKGTVYELTGDWENAQKAYEHALALAEQGTHPADIAKSEQALGVMCRWRGEYDSALIWLEKSRQRWKTLAQIPDLIQTQVQIGIIHWRKGDFAAARAQFEESLSLARQTHDLKGMAFAINNLGNVAWRQGDHAAAEKFHEENLLLRRQLGGKRGIAVALNNVGAIAHEQGNYSKAIQFYKESLALAREVGDKQGISLSLDNLGMVAQEQGDHTLARSLYQESLVLAWELGDKPGILSCLSNLGIIALERRDFVEAGLLYEQALEIAQAIDDKFSIRMIRFNQGYLAYEQADLATAQSRFQESLLLSVEIIDKRGLSHSLLGLSGVAARQNTPIRAGHLLAAAETLRQDIRQAWESIQRRLFEDTLAVLQTALGHQFDEIWTQGQNMPLTEILPLTQTPLEK